MLCCRDVSRLPPGLSSSISIPPARTSHPAHRNTSILQLTAVMPSSITQQQQLINSETRLKLLPAAGPPVEHSGYRR